MITGADYNKCSDMSLEQTNQPTDGQADCIMNLRSDNLDGIVFSRIFSRWLLSGCD